MRQLSDVLLPDHPGYTDVEAMRAYHDAQVAGFPAEEVERLRFWRKRCSR